MAKSSIGCMCRHCKSNHPNEECRVGHTVDEKGNFKPMSPVPDYIKKAKGFDYRDYHKGNKVGWVR